MNRLLVLTLVLFSFLIATTFSEEELVPYKQVYALPIKLKKVGPNKSIAEFTWDGVNEPEDGNVVFFLFYILDE